MASSGAKARVAGTLLILQMAGLIVPYVMLHPISRGEWLANAAGSAGSIQMGCAGLILTCAIAISVSLLFRPLISSAGAKALIAVSVLMLVLQSVDVYYLLQMLALSEQSVQGQSVGALAQDLAATRRTVHYAGLTSIDLWMFLFYGLLHFGRLVPRALAAFGFLTVALHFFGLLLPMILGGKGVTALGATMALGHLILGGWLIARGFSTPVLAAAEE